MDKLHAKTLQEQADSGALQLSNMRREAEMMARQVTGQIGRNQAIMRAVEFAPHIQNCTVADIQKLAQFCYDFLRTKDA